MRHMALYDMMETVRNTNQWLGATARTMASYPGLALIPHPGIRWMAAWGEVTERAFERMIAKPDWGIDSVTGDDGRDHVVQPEVILEKPFGDLVHFDVAGGTSSLARSCWLRRCPVITRPSSGPR